MVTPTKFIFGPKKKGSQKKEKKRGKKIEQPKTIFVWPPQKKIQKKRYWCYYPHWSRDSVSPVCGIFEKIRLGLIQTDNIP